MPPTFINEDAYDAFEHEELEQEGFAEHDAEYDSDYRPDDDFVAHAPVRYTNVKRTLHTGDIDLNPSYQREVVWGAARQSALIDSLYRGYYVPPIVFAIRNDPELGKIRVCVDGKQRLSAIQQFIDGTLPYKHSRTQKKLYMSTNLHDSLKQKQRVPQFWEQHFLDLKIDTVEYEKAITETMEREIFERVQNGVPLQASEKLQALGGTLVPWIGELQQKYFTQEGGLNSSIVNLGTEHSKDFECLARAVYLIAHMPNQKLPGYASLAKWLKAGNRPSQEFADSINWMLGILTQLAREKSTVYTEFSGRLAPVEFIYMCLVTAKLRGKPASEIAPEIGQLRRTLREKHQNDVRANNRVCATAAQYAQGVIPVPDFSWIHDTNLIPPPPSRNNNASKRGRKKSGLDSDDSDYDTGRRATKRR
ncbi:hypothetical protein BKA62DRAFT_781616 [Auriculariales sp. MPI-PUGE-AT-0066]|nr:hypothetical protein BKA62DRAFT_781616 [Auriculariales sp. MPI-PUGE-AT-0066]